jgi:hypothetical protein
MMRIHTMMEKAHLLLMTPVFVPLKLSGQSTVLRRFTLGLTRCPGRRQYSRSSRRSCTRLRAYRNGTYCLFVGSSSRASSSARTTRNAVTTRETGTPIRPGVTHLRLAARDDRPDDVLEQPSPLRAEGVGVELTTGDVGRIVVVARPVVQLGVVRLERQPPPAVARGTELVPRPVGRPEMQDRQDIAVQPAVPVVLPSGLVAVADQEVDEVLEGGVADGQRACEVAVATLTAGPQVRLRHGARESFEVVDRAARTAGAAALRTVQLDRPGSIATAHDFRSGSEREESQAFAWNASPQRPGGARRSLLGGMGVSIGETP